MQILNGYGRRCGLCLLCAAYATIPGFAQQQTEGIPQVQNGFSFGGTSVYSTYYSLGMPPSLLASGAGVNQAGADVSIAASTAFSYARHSERTTMSLLLTPSYSRRVRYSDWSAFNNTVGLQFTRSITSRFQLLISGSGALRNREELQFNPISSLLPAGGATTSPSLLPLPGAEADPAAQALFFGSRILTANVRTGVRYMLRPRIAITGGITGNRIQYLQTRRDEQLQQPTATAMIPQVTSVAGDFGMAYDLSERTNIGVTFDTSRQQSRLQNALITNTRFQVERTLTRHWMVNGYGGLGMIRRLQQQVALPSGGQMQYIAGASATFQSYAHTFTGSFDRRIADIYGVGANSSFSLTGFWRWAKPTSRYQTSLSFGRTQLQSLSFPATTWRATADVGRRIAGNVSVTANYSYIGYANTLVLQSSTFNQHAVRVGFSWMPGFQP